MTLQGEEEMTRRRLVNLTSLATTQDNRRSMTRLDERKMSMDRESCRRIIHVVGINRGRQHVSVIGREV